MQTPPDWSLIVIHPSCCRFWSRRPPFLKRAGGISVSHHITYTDGPNHRGDLADHGTELALASLWRARADEVAEQPFGLLDSLIRGGTWMKKLVAALPGASTRQVHVRSTGSRPTASTGGANKTCGVVAGELEYLVRRREYQREEHQRERFNVQSPPCLPSFASGRLWSPWARSHVGHYSLTPVISTGLAITKEI